MLFTGAVLRGLERLGFMRIRILIVLAVKLFDILEHLADAILAEVVSVTSRGATLAEVAELVVRH